MDLVSTPTINAFDDLVSSAREQVLVCSPYIGREPCERLCQLVDSDTPIRILCDLQMQTVLSGATQPSALAKLCTERPNTSVFFVPAVHAKVYISDQARALVTSANMTYSGMRTNFEYGVLLREKRVVSQIHNDIESCIKLGAGVSVADLEWMENFRKENAEVASFTRDDLGWRILDTMTEGIAEAHKNFLQIRAAGRTPHAIFSDAIVHCLVRGPLTTPELHQQIQSIHPDFCDDSVDRVIDDKHFGKKWKHAVRTAQQQLKRDKKIRLEDGYWDMIEYPTLPRHPENYPKS